MNDETRRTARLLEWASVLLAVLAFAQPAIAVGSAVHVLAGGLDEEWFVSYSYDDQGNESREVLPDVSFWDRWDVLTWTASPVLSLLAAGAVVVALAGLHLAVGHRRTTTVLARAAAVVAAGSTSLAALAQFLVTLVGTQREGAEESYVGWPTSFIALATPMATLAAVAVFAGVATVVLLHGPLPAEALRPETTEVPGTPELPGTPEVPETPELPETPTGTVEEEPVPVSIPRLREEDVAWYRRPGS